MQRGLAPGARDAAQVKKRAWFGIVLAAAATQALAQFGGSSRRGSRDKSSGERGKDGAPAEPNMLEVTLHEFHEDLKLTPAQEPAWDSYADKVRALAGDIARASARARSASQGALLARIDQTVDAARDRLTALEEIAAAAKALYAGLTPGQQGVCDPRLANIMATPMGASVSDSIVPRRK
jgi:protein CpxP